MIFSTSVLPHPELIELAELFHHTSGSAPACYALPNDSTTIAADGKYSEGPVLIVRVDDDAFPMVNTNVTTMSAEVIELPDGTSKGVLALGDRQVQISAAELGRVLLEEMTELDVLYMTESQIASVRYRCDADIVEDLANATIVAQENRPNTECGDTQLEPREQSVQHVPIFVADIYLMHSTPGGADRLHADLAAVEKIAAESLDMQAAFVPDVVSFLRDCRIEPAELDAVFIACLALEAAYSGQVGFWRRIDTATVANAIKQYEPNFAPTQEFKNWIADYLRTNQFDEMCAERLLAVPHAERPTDEDGVIAWLYEDLRRRCDSETLTYAKKDGIKAGESILDMLDCIESRMNNRPNPRIASGVAHSFRQTRLSAVVVA